jgi:hypothetical protein
MRPHAPGGGPAQVSFGAGARSQVLRPPCCVGLRSGDEAACSSARAADKEARRELDRITARVVIADLHRVIEIVHRAAHCPAARSAGAAPAAAEGKRRSVTTL